MFQFLGPKVVLMWIVATIFQGMEESEKCDQIGGMLQTPSGTMAVYESSYLSKQKYEGPENRNKPGPGQTGPKGRNAHVF